MCKYNGAAMATGYAKFSWHQMWHWPEAEQGKLWYTTMWRWQTENTLRIRQLLQNIISGSISGLAFIQES